MLSWKRMFSLLIAALLCIAIIPASAQYEVEGAWQAYGDYGTATLVFGNTGAYIALTPNLQIEGASNDGLWQSNGMLLDSGIYIIQEAYLIALNYSGEYTWWRYNLDGNKLYLLNEQSGIYFNLTRVNLLMPEGISGEWKDIGGEFGLTVREDCSFIQTLSDGTSYQGVWIADNYYLTLSYDDGDAYLCRYVLEPSSLILYNSDMTELLGSLIKPAAVETATSMVTPVPKFDMGPTVLTPAPTVSETQVPAVTEALPTEEPLEVTPEPVSEVSVEPALISTTDVPTEPLYTASGLIGRWRGTDSQGTRVILFTAEGTVEISYHETELADLTKKGTFLSDEDNIQVTYEDGTMETFHYVLMGDYLLLSDDNLQNPVTYTRISADN